MFAVVWLFATTPLEFEATPSFDPRLLVPRNLGLWVAIPSGLIPEGRIPSGLDRSGW